MNYTIEELKGEVKIDFTLSESEWDGYVEKSYQKNKNKFNIPGFRKGKATRKMIEKMYGGGVFFDDAINEAFYESYNKALTEHEEIYPVDDPRVDIDSMDGEIKFHAVVTVKPEVKLGAYKGIKVDKVEYNVAKEDVDNELNRQQKQSSRNVEVSGRAVQNGDIVNLDYSGSVDGVKFDGGTASNQELVIGSGAFIPGFEEQMIGMNEGETKDLKVTFPTEYHAENLKGKDAIFNVTVNKIYVEELPELNDEFAKEHSKFETLAEMRTDIENNLKAERERRANNENENALINAVTESAEIEIPDCMVERQIDYMVQDMEYRLMYMYQGMKLEDYLKYTGSSLEQFRNERKDDALKTVKTRLAVEAIVKAENLEATDTDVEKEIEETAKKMEKNVDEYRKTIDERQLSYIKNDLTMKKLMDFLKANNEFVLKKQEKKESKKAE